MTTWTEITTPLGENQEIIMADDSSPSPLNWVSDSTKDHTFIYGAQTVSITSEEGGDTLIAGPSVPALSEYTLQGTSGSFANGPVIMEGI